MNATTYTPSERASKGDAATEHPLLSSPTVYERSGYILDINTLRVNRDALHAALALPAPSREQQPDVVLVNRARLRSALAGQSSPQEIESLIASTEVYRG